jgi:hypothetical protein
MHTPQFIILGLGGTVLSDTYALETAWVFNEINPGTGHLKTSFTICGHR